MTVELDTDILSSVQLFEDLNHSEINKIREIITIRNLPAETNLIMAEQPGESIFIVLQGTVKIQVDQPDGKYVILAILGPGETVGEMSLVDNQTRSASVITLEPATIGWMSRSSFLECVRSMPTLNFNLTRLLSRRLRLANQQTQTLATQDVYGRVARQVLTFAQEYGVPASDGSLLIPFRLTQSDLAGMIGATRVRVNQVLVTYRRLNYISIDQNYRITVRDQRALAQRCDGF